MSRTTLDAYRLFGKGLLNGFGPGNTGEDFEYIVYASAFDVYGFFEVPPNYSYSLQYHEQYTNPSNPRVTTATAGTGSVAYETNGGLTIESGTTATGAASAYNVVAGPAISSLALAHTHILATDMNSNTGAYEFAIGITDAATMPTNATTDEGAWLYTTCTAGVQTTYACTSNGTTTTATDVTASLADISTLSSFYIIVSSTNGTISSISFYQNEPGVNDALLATITTNLPADDALQNTGLRHWVETGDTTNRALTLNNTRIVYAQ